MPSRKSSFLDRVGMPVPGKIIAEGSTAFVHEVADVGETRVFKIARSAEFNAALLGEARLASELKHEALLPVLDFGVNDEGHAWLLLPRRGALDLRKLRLSDVELIEALGPVADVLDHLHQKGWVHGDLKPANLLAGDKTTPLLLADLGFTVPVGEISESGSAAYLSPARLDRSPLTPGDDLFAFAVLCYEMLVGSLPFVETEGEALLRSIRTGRTHPPTTLRPDLPRESGRPFSDLFSGISSPASVTIWLDSLRAAFSLEPAAARLRYLGAPFPHERILGEAASWIDRPPFSQGRLGRAILLRNAGRGEARLLRSGLEGRGLRDWMEEGPGDLRVWIAGMEEPPPPGASPRPAVFASRELDEEQVGYLAQRPDTQSVDWPDWSPADLRAYLEAGLESPGQTEIRLGEEEFRFLLEQCGNDFAEIEEGLTYLCEAGLLRSLRGRAVFIRPPQVWKEPWQLRREPRGLSGLAEDLLALLSSTGLPLSGGECGEVLSAGRPALDSALGELLTGGWARRAGEGRVAAAAASFVAGRPPLPTFSDDWLTRLWERADSRSDARARILILAGRQGARGWISRLDPAVFLAVADGVSLSTLKEAASALDEAGRRSASGVLLVVALLRGGRLPEAVEAFWHCEPALDLSCSGELSRRLFTELMRSLGLDEGYEFLESWKRARAGQIQNGELEIRIAARECMSFGMFGDLDEALRRLELCRRRFSGRPGLWFLDWAEGLIHGDRRDHAAAASSMARALEKIPEDADLGDRFSLNIQTANQCFLVQDLERGRGYLDLAREIAARPEARGLGRYLESGLGLYCKVKGDLDAAEKHYRRALRMASEEGLWREPAVLRGNLAGLLLDMGEYGRLLPLLRQIERHVEVGESIRDAIQERGLLASIYLDLGLLGRAESMIEELRALAAESDSAKATALAFMRRVRLRRLRGEFTEAGADLDSLTALKETMSPMGRVDLDLEILRSGREAAGSIDAAGRIIELCVRRGWIVQRGWARILRSRLLRFEGDRERSELDLREAGEDARSSRNPELRTALHSEWSVFHETAGDSRSAKFELGRAIEGLHALSGKIDDVEIRSCFLRRPDRVLLLERFRALAD